MGELKQFVKLCDRRIYNLAVFASHASTDESVWRKYDRFLGYISGMRDAGWIEEGRYWYYRSCARSVVNKYAPGCTAIISDYHA